jgi:hypothetical protein
MKTRGILKAASGWILLLLIFSLPLAKDRSSGTARRRFDRTQTEPQKSHILAPPDKKQLREFLRMKEKFGGCVWPGFDEAVIPLILYDRSGAFLVFHPSPPPLWNKVDSDSFDAQTYFRRPPGIFQAFAVKVGDFWAGSLATLDHMNESMESQIRENLPPEKITPAFLKMMEITPAWHAVALLHEAFHALQASRCPGRFERATEVYALEDSYPYGNAIFNQAWNEEGQALAAALLEKDDRERRKMISTFLEIRDARRSSHSLPAELISFERDLEWLEGSAKFVEMRFAELGAFDSVHADDKGYTVTRGRLRVDFFTRLRKLGELSGDGRFYLSGAAQAMLLDLVRKSWKDELWADDEQALEDLLRPAGEFSLNRGMKRGPV